METPIILIACGQGAMSLRHAQSWLSELDYRVATYAVRPLGKNRVSILLVIRIFMLIKELRVHVNDFILEWGLDLFFGLQNVDLQSLLINE